MQPIHAISGSRQIFWIRLEDVGKHIFLFSDHTHSNEQCDHPVSQPVEEYLYALSHRFDAEFYLEGSERFNIFQGMDSHIERAYQLFHTPHVNRFRVHLIDERFSTSTLSQKVAALSGAVHSNHQALYNVVARGNYEVYRQIIQPEVQFVLNKYHEADTEFNNSILRMNFADLILFYNEFEANLIEENQTIQTMIQLGRFDSIDPESYTYEFLATFYMFMVDLPFFSIMLRSDKQFHFGYMGNMHVNNIKRIFHENGKDVRDIQGNDHCTLVQALNQTLNL